MDKIKFQPGPDGFPMPVTLVGYESEGKPNFVAVSWVTRVNNYPHMIAIAPGSRGPGLRIAGIVENGAFSVNLPGVGLLQKVDYCALHPGEDEDKSHLFQVFRGDLKGAPMIRECPMCMECKLVTTLSLPTHDLYIGEVVAFYAEGDCFFGGAPDPGLWQPFLLTRPDDLYWSVGPAVGDAWCTCEDLNGKKPASPPELIEEPLEDTWPGTDPLDIRPPEARQHAGKRQEETWPGADPSGKPEPKASWLEHFGEPLAPTAEEASSFLNAQLERAVPEGWAVQPVKGQPLAWTMARKNPGDWAEQNSEYGIRISDGLDLVIFTCENNDIGALSLHHFLLNAMVIDAAALLQYGMPACLEYLVDHHKPNQWGYT